MYFGTKVRKKFIFEPQLSLGNSPLYEGIGTSRGLFVGPCSGTIGFESGSVLRCFSIGNETIQLSASGDCETTPSGYEVNSDQLMVHTISNPLEDIIVVQYISDSTNEVNMKLYDLHGNLVRTQTLERENPTEISTDGLETGMYFILVEDGEKVISSEMFKIEK